MQTTRSYLRFPATASVCADWVSVWVTHESVLRLNLSTPKLCAEEMCSTHVFIIILHTDILGAIDINVKRTNMVDT